MVTWILNRRDPHALDRLQRVQESIYAQLQCLLPSWDVALGAHWVSQVPSGMPLHIEVLECHPYTTFLRLTHHFIATGEVESEPEAHVRCYHDLHIAEVTAFDTLQGIRRLAHPSLPPRALMRLNWQRNRSLEKWLQYLLDLGHCRGTLRPAPDLDTSLDDGEKKGLVTI